MGDRYYKPVLADDEHLLHSRLNPNNNVGLTMADDGRRGIPQWECYDLDEIIEKERRCEELKVLAAESKKLAQERAALEQEEKLIRAETRSEVWYIIGTVANCVINYYQRNPQKLIQLHDGIVRNKNNAANWVRKTKLQIQRKQRMVPLEEEVVVLEPEKEIEEPTLEISVNEARERVLRLIKSYCETVEQFEFLKRARVNDQSVIQSQSLEQLLTGLNGLVSLCPAIKGNSELLLSINQLLDQQTVEIDMRQIRETLYLDDGNVCSGE